MPRVRCSKDTESLELLGKLISFLLIRCNFLECEKLAVDEPYDCITNYIVSYFYYQFLPILYFPPSY